ncbi:MAG: rhamnogalacturonan acetylesterase [Prevotella sp.]|nr:rhamnogalacturonan acetylesterase [Prevotella sp.]
MKKIAFALLILLMLTAADKERTTTIFMIGDSTMANKDISKGKKERGWGMALQCFFDDNIVIDNHAVNGRSSLSFINEGRWDAVLKKMKPGDYVIIQFGHNDEKPKADRHTDPGSTFDYNLAKFVRETREHGGTPILMNCVVRRNFAKVAPKNDDDEALRNQTFADAPKLVESDSLVDTHGLYRVAPRDVAKRMNVHFVDANKITHNLEQGLGKEASKKLHMWFLPGEEPSVPAGKQDNTHYNIYGAHVVAGLLADALCEEIPILKKYRTDADMTVDSHGRGEYMKLSDAVEKALKDPKKATTIQILGGTWEKPKLPKKHHISFIMREGAEWK